ncbi:MAG: hypothetical protein ACEPO8_08080 [Rhodothermaceae bacterium]
MLHTFSNSNSGKYIFRFIKSALLVTIFLTSILSVYPEFDRTIILKCDVEFSQIDLDSESVYCEKSKTKFDFNINDPILSSTKKSFDKILSLKSKKFLIQNPRTFKSKILFKSFLATHLHTDISDLPALS